MRVRGLLLSGRFVLGHLQGDFPSVLASQHRVYAKAVASKLLVGSKGEIVFFEDGQGYLLAADLLVLVPENPRNLPHGVFHGQYFGSFIAV